MGILNLEPSADSQQERYGLPVQNNARGARLFRLAAWRLFQAFTGVNTTIATLLSSKTDGTGQGV